MKRTTLFILALILGSRLYAYDFADGGIFYDITSPGTVAVTYETQECNSYSGAVVVPAAVENGGATYAVTAIGDYAFGYCAGLTAVSLPESIASVGNCAFVYCTALTEIDIPDAVGYMGMFAFSGCSSLARVRLPASLETLEYAAFQNCSSLRSISLPASLTTIGNDAFYGSGLGSIAVGDAVTIVGYGAFSQCSDLASAVVGSSVTEIGNYAFAGCTSLAAMTLRCATPPATSAHTFDYVRSELHVVVPCNAAPAYSAADGWSAFPDITEDCTAISERNALNVSVFPNPASGIVRIGAEGFVSATLFSLSGNRLLESNQPTLDLGSLPSGGYLLEISTLQGKTLKKVVRQ